MCYNRTRTRHEWVVIGRADAVKIMRTTRALLNNGARRIDDLEEIAILRPFLLKPKDCIKEIARMDKTDLILINRFL